MTDGVPARGGRPPAWRRPFAGLVPALRRPAPTRPPLPPAADAMAAFAAMVRDQVDPVLCAAGFGGSAPDWALVAPNGDRAIVAAQVERAAPGEVRFAVDLAVVPEPWWAWVRTRSPDAPAEPRAAHGVWRDRLHPLADSGSGGWVVHDAATAYRAGTDVAAQLTEVAIPRLTRLLDRNVLATVLRSGADGLAQGTLAGGDPALAALIVDNGPSAELDTLLARIGDERYVAWLRARAAAPPPAGGRHA